MTSPLPSLSTLVELLRGRAQQQPAQRALTFLADETSGEQSLTYAELDQRARSLAAHLQQHAEVGERALLLYPPGLDYIVAFFGCLYAGVIAVPAYPPRLNRPMPRLLSMVADCQATLALTIEGIRSRIEGRISEESQLAALHWVSTDTLGHEQGDAWHAPAIEGESLAFLQYTSGSTAAPKGVMVSHRNLLHNSSLIQRAFESGPQSTGVIWLPPFHDMGLIGGILQPLYAGFPVVLISPMAFLQRPLRWLELVSEYRATISGGPNFAYELCVQKSSPEQRAALDLSRWEVAFNGAEPIRQETMTEFAAAFAPSGFRYEAFYPCYGLAEATLIASGGERAAPPLTHSVQATALARNEVLPATGDDARLLVGSGRSFPDQQLVIADPETCAPCPEGRVGEIWLAGASVAQGYWGNQEATARTFQARLAGSQAGPFLRTGDLGFLHEGELFVTGRAKDLIIIRGRNYYPQDIELTVERAHPALQSGGGAAFSVEVAGEEQLVIVQEVGRRHRNPNVEEVVSAVCRAVAEQHELQTYALLLLKPATLPKTSSGKVQRHACRQRFLDDALEAVARWQRGPTDESDAAPLLLPEQPQSVAEIQAWLVHELAAKIGVAPATIDVTQPIFQYGLDSLMAIELMHSLEAGLGVLLPMTTFMESPSVARLAAEIYEQLGTTPRDGEPIEELDAASDSCPLSPGQQALWFLYQLAPDSPAYNLAGAVRILSPLDVPALQRTFQTLVRRHASLRATFTVEAGQPVQRYHEEPRFLFEVTEATGWSEQALNERLIEAAHEPFDLEQGPLLRVHLFRRGEAHLLLLVIHHIIADFWSLALLAQEIGALYPAEARGDAPPLLPPVLPYRAFVRQQAALLSGAAGEREWQYWQAQLAGELPALTLPTDRPRPPVQGYRGGSQPFRLGAALTRKLLDYARDADCSPYMLLLAAFQLLLHRYSGQEEVLVGSPIAGRSRAELASIVGYCVNTLVLRSNVADDPTFRHYLGRVREQVLGAFAHQSYPFVHLVERLQPERDASRSPLFQAMFIYQQAPLAGQENITPLALGEAGTELTLGGLHLRAASLEQRIAQVDLTLVLALAGEELAASLQYNCDLFEPATIARMAHHFQTLLEAIVEQPAAPLSRLKILGEAEQQRMLVDWNDTRRAIEPLPLPHLFERQAAQTPARPALTCGEWTLSYDELNRRANQLARHLLELDVGPEVRVGISLERSPEMLIALLAVLKAGGAYVPLDPAFPRERLAYMLEDAQPAVLLTQTTLQEMLPSLALYESSNLEQTIDPAQVAYVLYTSGSTGNPKGVQIPHRALSNFLDTFRQTPGLSEQDRLLAVTTLSFDIAALELYLPLVTGAHLFLASQEVSADGFLLAEALARVDATVMQATPATWHMLLAAGWQGKADLTMLCGGEALPRDLAEALLSRGRALWNLYGPTESTIWSAIQPVAPGEGPVPIGKPVANTELYLLDRHLQPVPPGVLGEVYIGGLGLSRGYLKLPHLTAERFLPNPFSQEPGTRLYRTGDVGRYLPDGTLLYGGRNDAQIKLRGFRIELGEIEAVLTQHPALQSAAVILRQVGQEGGYLAAYLTAASGAVQEEEVRAFLSARLPEYMVPSTISLLDALPLTPNGKIDRRALAALETQRAREMTPPRTPTEQQLAALWQELLGLDQVGIHDNFFQLGGHSLLATQLAFQIQRHFEVVLPIRALLAAPTIAALAVAVEQAERIQAEPAITPRPRDGSLFPTSRLQRQLWFLAQLLPAIPVYNMPIALRLTGTLDVSALERAINALVARHESLRTTFVEVEGQPFQQLASELTIPLPVQPVASLDAVRQEAQREARQPFRLDVGPLLRARLLRLDEREHVLLLTLHHIIADGWSLGVLMQELTTLYEGNSLPALPFQFADVAQWQQEQATDERLDPLLAYWREQLQGSPAALELPTDFLRPATPTYQGARHYLTLPKSLTEALNRLSQREGSTLFMTLLATFEVVLHRYSGQDDISVGSPVAGRTQPGVEALIGPFVNTVVLRNILSPDMTFRELLGAVRESVLGAYAHQEIPFEKPPSFQVMFAFQNAPMPPLHLSGLALELLESDSGTAKFDLLLDLQEAESGLAGYVEYSTSLFEPATIARMVGQFQQLLEGVVASPDCPLARLPLLTPAEEAQFAQWNDTAVDFGTTLPIHRLIERQVEATPEAVALRFRDRALSYRALNERANQLAHYLRRQGVGPEARVGICLERSVEMVVALLAVLKAGGAYVPLDPEYPEERLAFMTEDARLSLRLTPEALDAIREQVAAEPTHNPEVEVSGQHLAYVIYTSGSTGRPKGAMNTHEAIRNRLLWMQAAYPLTAADRVLQKTPFSFDVSVWEFFWPLMTGACLVVAEPGGHRDSGYLVELIAREEISTLHFVPSMLQIFLAEPGVQRCHALKRVICSGEALPYDLQTRFFDLLPMVELHNLYGPTEAAVDVTAWSCQSHPRGIVPIGKPIANLQCYVLDARLAQVPVGVKSELYLGGIGLARGYLARPDLTAERFVPDPFSATGGERLYRTGDLARYLPDGTIEYLGRVDHQVKVRGFRIELGEIEAVLSQHEGVREAAVVVQPGGTLAGYFVPAVSPAPTPEDLRRYLQRTLPDYMVPSALVLREALPLTPNGKVDRAALARATVEYAAGMFVAASTPFEEVLAEIWQEVLGQPQVSVEDNFFELGGHSLLATQAMSRVRQRFQVELPLSDFFNAPTIRLLAQQIEEAKLIQSDAQQVESLLQQVERMSDEQAAALLASTAI